jgi:hypothetical protein
MTTKQEGDLDTRLTSIPIPSTMAMNESPHRATNNATPPQPRITILFYRLKNFPPQVDHPFFIFNCEFSTRS